MTRHIERTMTLLRRGALQSYGRDCAFRDPAGTMIRILQTRG